MKIATLEQLKTTLALRNKELCWQTKEGDIVLLNDMKDSHLKNTIKMLEKKGSPIIKEKEEFNPFEEFDFDALQG